MLWVLLIVAIASFFFWVSADFDDHEVFVICSVIHYNQVVLAARRYLQMSRIDRREAPLNQITHFELPSTLVRDLHIKFEDQKCDLLIHVRHPAPPCHNYWAVFCNTGWLQLKSIYCVLCLAHIESVVHLLGDAFRIIAGLKFEQWHDTCPKSAGAIEHESEDCFVIVVHANRAADIVSVWQSRQPAPFIL